MKKGIHFLFGVKDGVTDFPAVIDRFATLGFDCVELPPEPFLEGDAAKHIVSYAAERGVEILSCGTCLNFYDLKEKLAVGEVTNMYVIVEKMSGADRVVRP